MFKKRILTIASAALLASAAFAPAAFAAPTTSCPLPQCSVADCQEAGRHFHGDTCYCGQENGCDGTACQNATNSGHGCHRSSSSGSHSGHGRHH